MYGSVYILYIGCYTLNSGEKKDKKTPMIMMMNAYNAHVLKTILFFNAVCHYLKCNPNYKQTFLCVVIKKHHQKGLWSLARDPQLKMAVNATRTDLPRNIPGDLSP